MKTYSTWTKPSASQHMLKFFRQADPETKHISRAAEVFQKTLRVLKKKSNSACFVTLAQEQLLSWKHLKLIAELSKCPPTSPATCRYTHLYKYRLISGLCNNRQNPRWGAANTALVRWLPAEYEDGESEPKGWNPERLHNGFQLPPARTVSREIMTSASKWKDDSYSQLLVDWGQYISHDITLTPQSTSTDGSDVDCLKTCENVHPCFPIKMNDGLQGCMPFFRSTSDCFVNFQSGIRQALQRQQLNAMTSFIDASAVYGHNQKLESFLRDLPGRNGKLAVNARFKDPKGRPYLPFVTKLPSACHQDLQGERVECFSAGDNRVSEGLPLTSLHTLWLREHNRIAEALKHINGHWSPEMIYQETRKIIGALHQIITLRDYAPKIIGPESFKHYIGPYRGYDPSVDPSIANVFAAAAFRFGHATISPILCRLNESFQEDERFPHLRLHNTLFSPWRIVKEGGIEPVLRGVIGSAASAVSADMLLADEVTERLVVLDTLKQMDLAALNLQRGRDHGLPGKILAESQICHSNAIRLSSSYQSDRGLVERLLPGSRTGPLFACLIGRQMKVLRDGDRFWWEADGVFTQQQKEELLKFSLSHLICDNSDIGIVPLDPFRLGKYPSHYVSCDQIPSMNLEAWKDEMGEDLKRCGLPKQINNGDYILSSTSRKLVALYSCYHGFTLKGAAVIVCMGNRWCNQPPQCNRYVNYL
ncbi:thyroid peroxidase [Haplochromis burtoni]|uniref:thyroid peroxidase n=1 Tax=Haplochromis burtoni TaxID=8153 RepID=UPI001C2DCA3E|nr:thyroid peroxidase [Haplochromis burtoni]